MSDERISCPKCNKKSVPRLWHRSSIFTKQKIDHLCPFCGTTMYTTGGGLSAISILILIFLGMGILNAVISALAPNEGQQSTTSKVYQLSDKDLAHAQENINNSNIEIHALEEKIQKGSTPYLAERLQMYQKRKEKFQNVVNQYYEERKLDIR